MSRLPRRPYVDHAAVAARARQQAGEWQVVGEYRSRVPAEGAAHTTRTARPRRSGTTSPYAPAGAYETKLQLTEYGCLVLVKYVGGGAG
ncbi:hypothetical protein [Streptomyces longispororuber]|uniref:hypothetical protein n=1 Tax=Streptomyces longispororuber TaxID=68230 RepID=UPI0036FECB17